MAVVRRLVLLIVVFAWLALGLGVSSAQASVIVYTDESAFLAAVNGSTYTETFESLTPGFLPGPVDFSGSGFAYTATTTFFNEFFPFTPPGTTDVWLGPNWSGDPMTFSFTSGSPTAIGGFFYLSDFAGNPINGGVELTVSVAGTPTSYTVINGGLTTFVGFISDGGAFSSLVASPQGFAWPVVNDLTVAQAAPVPEPASLTLLGLGLAGMGARRWRQRKTS